MKEKAKQIDGLGAPQKKRSMLAITFERLKKDKLAVVGMIVFSLIVIAAVLAPVIAPYNYNDQDLFNTLSAPSIKNIFGTDSLGRDIFSRVLYGAKYSLTIGIVSVGVAMVFGCVVGSICGYYGGVVDMVIMRFMDLMQSVPDMLLAIAISAMLGPGFSNCILALSISRIPVFIRLMRASLLSLREMEYIDAEKSINASVPRIMFKHLLPNGIAPMIVQATMAIAGSILVAASLSFIGLGVQPPLPEWGAMLSEGRDYIRTCPHIVIFPGIMIMITVLSINLFGDGLRDALDPRLKD